MVSLDTSNFKLLILFHCPFLLTESPTVFFTLTN